jgi:hypothetical protein
MECCSINALRHIHNGPNVIAIPCPIVLKCRVWLVLCVIFIGIVSDQNRSLN